MLAKDASIVFRHRGLATQIFAPGRSITEAGRHGFCTSIGAPLGVLGPGLIESRAGADPAATARPDRGSVAFRVVQLTYSAGARERGGL